MGDILIKRPNYYVCRLERWKRPPFSVVRTRSVGLLSRDCGEPETSPSPTALDHGITVR